MHLDTDCHVGGLLAMTGKRRGAMKFEQGLSRYLPGRIASSYHFYFQGEFPRNDGEKEEAQ
jgi:hypothetical protein